MANIGEFIGDLSPIEQVGGGSKRNAQFAFTFTVDGSGDVKAVDHLPGGVEIVHSAAGEYDLVFPSAIYATVYGGMVEPPTNAAGERRQVELQLVDAPLGSIELLIVSAAGAGTGADPVEDSKVHVAGMIDYT